MRFTTTEIVDATGGSRSGPDCTVDGVTQDSRRVEPGRLFVPLVAERDGHEFIAAALRAGAAAYLTDREPIGGSAVRVDDTMSALADLARVGRARIEGPVIGITGSVGKTSTKDLLAAVLGRNRPTHASERSFNNELGVPLTILNAPDGTEALVVEMGARGIGHIRVLCGIAAPTIGIVTTVAGAHTGEFGTIANIALAKGELVEALPPDGLAVLNADVPLAADMADRTDATVLTFGATPGADVRFTNVRVDGDLRVTFTIESEWGIFDLAPSTRGAHLVPNAAAATACALWLGCSIEEIADGVSDAALSPLRMELRTTSTGATIINDTYNANPTSMRGAIDALVALDSSRKIAILGYMGELGADEAVAHAGVADYANRRGVEVIAVGTELYGVDPVDDPAGAVGALGDRDAVLIKASRSAGLEIVADELLDR